MSECGLYRHFDANGTLLYVGISVNPFTRFRQHKASDKDMSKVSRMDVSWYPSERAARTAEWKAIKVEAPLWNKQRPKVAINPPTSSKNPMSWRTFAIGDVPCGVYDFFFQEGEMDRVVKLLRHGDRVQIGNRYFSIPHGFNIMPYVLERARKISGQDVKVHHLKRRYGNRWATPKEPEA